MQVSGQGVRLTCHTHQQDENTLAFSMSFVNHRGRDEIGGFVFFDGEMGLLSYKFVIGLKQAHSP